MVPLRERPDSPIIPVAVAPWAPGDRNRTLGEPDA